MGKYVSCVLFSCHLSVYLKKEMREEREMKKKYFAHITAISEHVRLVKMRGVWLTCFIMPGCFVKTIMPEATEMITGMKSEMRPSCNQFQHASFNSHCCYLTVYPSRSTQYFVILLFSLYQSVVVL